MVFGNAGGLLNLILFVFLLTFLASIFASQLFRGEIPQEDDGDEIHVSFLDIYNSFLGMYQIFSSENWTETLFNVTNYQKQYGIAWIGASFLIIWFIFANCKSRGLGGVFFLDICAEPCTLTPCSHRPEHVYCRHSGKL